MVLLVRFLAAAPGCPFSTPSAVLGMWRGILVLLAWREAWRTSSLLSKPKEPAQFSSPLCFLKPFDHAHGHCIFILMLRFF